MYNILGPLLYLIYINYIDIATSCQILSFADDTSLFLSNSNLDTCILLHDANIEMNKLYNWFCANKLSLNANKTKFMVFRSPYLKCDFLNHHIEVNGTRLTRVGTNCSEQSVKFLGVIMDEFVSWKHHISISRAGYLGPYLC